jgi:uncharacterized protein
MLLMDAHKIAEDNLFFYCVTGSRAYDMATKDSDTDYRGLFYSPAKIYRSLFQKVDQVEKFGSKKDSVVYELSKYVKLLVDQNPNILELLWLDRKFVILNTPIYEMLRSEKDFFLSSKSKFTFSGFAISQLKRIKGHNKWINNPQPKRRPKEIDFVSVIWNATDNKEYNKVVPFKGYWGFNLGGDVIGLLKLSSEDFKNPEEECWHDNHEALRLIPVKDLPSIGNDRKQFDLVVKFNRQLYKEHVENWQHYWEWKNNRNEARATLEEQHGYDTKHASHLVRLLRMGVEILRGEGVRVHRPDADELLSIRNGAWTYEQIVKYSEDLDRELDSLYKTTKLPHHIDQQKTDDIVNKIYDMCWEADGDQLGKDFLKIGYKYVEEV